MKLSFCRFRRCHGKQLCIATWSKIVSFCQISILNLIYISHLKRTNIQCFSNKSMFKWSNYWQTKNCWFRFSHHTILFDDQIGINNFHTWVWFPFKQMIWKIKVSCPFLIENTYRRITNNQSVTYLFWLLNLHVTMKFFTPTPADRTKRKSGVE